LPQPHKGPNLTHQRPSSIDVLDAHGAEPPSLSLDRTVTDLDNDGYSEHPRLT
jgi:hypothetical protein